MLLRVAYAPTSLRAGRSNERAHGAGHRGRRLDGAILEAGEPKLETGALTQFGGAIVASTTESFGIHRLGIEQFSVGYSLHA